jgi:hypothetical protein
MSPNIEASSPRDAAVARDPITATLNLLVVIADMIPGSSD